MIRNNNFVNMNIFFTQNQNYDLWNKYRQNQQRYKNIIGQWYPCRPYLQRFSCEKNKKNDRIRKTWFCTNCMRYDE